MTRWGGMGTASVVAAIWAFASVQPWSLVHAQSGTAVLSGSVTADHDPVVAFRVKARDTVRRISYTVFTRQGRYAFHALPAGRYEVVVLEDGYDSPAQTV